MYIPSQEERYAKKGLISLTLCLIAPSCLYLTILSEQISMIKGHEWDAVMKVFLAFSYPLAALFAMIGLPFFWWAVIISGIIHAAIIGWLKITSRLTPKQAICVALSLGMLDFLLVKLFPFPLGIMN